VKDRVSSELKIDESGVKVAERERALTSEVDNFHGKEAREGLSAVAAQDRRNLREDSFCISHSIIPSRGSGARQREAQRSFFLRKRCSYSDRDKEEFFSKASPSEEADDFPSMLARA